MYYTQGKPGYTAFVSTGGIFRCPACFVTLAWQTEHPGWFFVLSYFIIRSLLANEETVQRVKQDPSFRYVALSPPPFSPQGIAEGWVLLGMLAVGGMLAENTSICPGIWSVSPELSHHNGWL